MAAAAPIIGSIITSIVVSKAVQEIGPRIGMSDDMTSLLSFAAAAYAGGYTYNTTAAAAGGAAGGAGAAGTAGGAYTSPPGPHAGAAAPPVSNIPGTPLAPSDSPYASRPTAGASEASMAVDVPKTRGGMMTESASPPPTTRAPAGTDTAGSIIESSTQQGLHQPVEDSWMSRLFSPEKTMDLVMAGVKGYGQAGIEEYKLEYPEKVATENAQGWAEAYPGQKQLAPYAPPSQGGR